MYSHRCFLFRPVDKRASHSLGLLLRRAVLAAKPVGHQKQPEHSKKDDYFYDNKPKQPTGKA